MLIACSQKICRQRDSANVDAYQKQKERRAKNCVLILHPSVPSATSLLRWWLLGPLARLILIIILGFLGWVFLGPLYYAAWAVCIRRG